MRWYPGQATPEVTEREVKMRAIARRAAAEGMVLLENKGMLPLKAGTKIALYGQGARRTIKGGTGSGDVNSRNTVTVDGGLREAGYRIVNRAYLDRYDEAYAENLKRWKEAVYAEAGNDRDPKKLYHAHATIRPELPDIPIMPEDAADAEALICGRNLRK
jgi:beta-glucosidase